MLSGKSTESFRIKDAKINSLKPGSARDPLNKKREGLVDPLTSKARLGNDPLSRLARPQTEVAKSSKQKKKNNYKLTLFIITLVLKI